MATGRINSVCVFLILVSCDIEICKHYLRAPFSQNPKSITVETMHTKQISGFSFQVLYVVFMEVSMHTQLKRNETIKDAGLNEPPPLKAEQIDRVFMHQHTRARARVHACMRACVHVRTRANTYTTHAWVAHPFNRETYTRHTLGWRTLLIVRHIHDTRFGGAPF